MTRKTALPYVLVAPAVVFLLLITLYPAAFALYQSFFLVRFTTWTPIGFDNYITLLSDREFWLALWNTVLMGSVALLIECTLALFLAFHAYRDQFITGWRIVFLLPMLFMPSAVAFIWTLAFNDARVISDLLIRLGVVDTNISFLSSVWRARLVLIITDVWQWTPFLFIVFIAALQSQNPEIEEAARLDGAGPWRVFCTISLPLMRPVIVIAVVLRAIDITTMFTNVFIITQGAPGGTTETLSYFIYRIGFKNFDFGYASAISVVVLLITLVVCQTIVKRAFRSIERDTN